MFKPRFNLLHAMALAMRTACVTSALALLAVAAPAVAQPASTEGEIYSALGTEPFWSVTFEEGKMIYTAPDQERIEVVRPRPTTTRNGTHIYRTPRMTVEIGHDSSCNDGMSDFTYPDTVRVRFGSAPRARPLEGCGGGILPPTTLADTGWAIIDIDGTRVGGEDYELQFDGSGRLSGRAGCNRFSGPYTQRGRSLTPGAIVSTRMGCPGERQTHERKVLQVLRGPVQISYGGGQTMTLRSGEGNETVFVTLWRL